LYPFPEEVEESRMRSDVAALLKRNNQKKEEEADLMQKQWRSF
jgi:hypothetical protein